MPALLMFRVIGTGVEVAKPVLVFRTSHETEGLTVTPNCTDPLVAVTSKVCCMGSAADDPTW